MRTCERSMCARVPARILIDSVRFGCIVCDVNAHFCQARADQARRTAIYDRFIFAAMHARQHAARSACAFEHIPSDTLTDKWKCSRSHSAGQTEPSSSRSSSRDDTRADTSLHREAGGDREHCDLSFVAGVTVFTHEFAECVRQRMSKRA